MPRVTKKQVESAKALDLLSYMQLYEPHNLMRKGNDYCTKEHDSLIISKNGLWHWKSRDIGGKTALDYLIKIKDMDFVSAVLLLCNKEPQIQSICDRTKIEKKPFELPKPYSNNKCVIEYLQSRGLSDEVIQYCISNGLIYESKKYHNAVFVGSDTKGMARYAALRGTWQHMSNPFKGEVEGSDKRYSFSVCPDKGSTKLVVSESAIDVLSVATIRQDIGNEHYLSIGGAYAPKKQTDKANLPKALEQYLQDHTEIKEVELALDNDEVGIGASFFIMNKLKGLGYTVSSTPPNKGKDWNEFITMNNEKFR